MESDAELVRLRTALRDLVAISNLQAAWAGRDPPDIAAGLADVLIEAIAAEVGILPRPHLQLAGAHRPVHVDPCTGQPLEMLFPEIGIHDVERSLSALNAVLDERAKDPVLLLDAVEESANVTLPPENAPGELHGTVVGFHRLPHRRSVVQSDVSCRSVPRAADR